MPESKRVFITDCEGPISKNDNAFELMSQFVPNGDKIFSVISKYDDVQADIVQRTNYKAGDTLKLMIPFLKAYEVTDEKMEKFSSESIVLVPQIKENLKRIRKAGPAYMVSTSYEHYIRSLCKEIDFLFENTYSTRLRIDDYDLGQTSESRLKEYAEWIAKMPVIKIPKSAKSVEDLSFKDQDTVDNLNYIFWAKIKEEMTIGKVFDEIKTVGGIEKANAINDIANKLNTNLSEVMYVGDSITDVEAFRNVKESGGLAVSFNGNGYAVREAEVGIVSKNADVIGELGEKFLLYGKNDVINHINSTKDQNAKALTKENRDRFAEYSSEFRKTFRGEAVGRLG